MSDSLTKTAQAKEHVMRRAHWSSSIRLTERDVDALIAAVLADHDAQTRQDWQPIETAPRNPPRDILVFCPAKDPPRREIFQAWWAMPYDGAAVERGWWCYDGNKVMLSADFHDGLGATHWMPLPAPPAQKGTP